MAYPVVEGAPDIDEILVRRNLEGIRRSADEGTSPLAGVQRLMRSPRKSQDTLPGPPRPGHSSRFARWMGKQKALPAAPAFQLKCPLDCSWAPRLEAALPGHQGTRSSRSSAPSLSAQGIHIPVVRLSPSGLLRPAGVRSTHTFVVLALSLSC